MLWVLFSVQGDGGTWQVGGRMNAAELEAFCHDTD